MVFIWPDLLWACLLVPFLVAAYIWLHHKRKRIALRYAHLSIARQALGKRSSLQRHMPPALFLASLAFLLTAGARPAAVMTLPTAHKTIVLAIDVSGSMLAHDIQPSRIQAAQDAAKQFVTAQPPHTQIGVVAFAGTANLIQPPTSNRNQVLSAIDRLDLQPATAIGSGILISLKALFPEQRFDTETDDPRRDPRDTRSGASLNSRGRLSKELNPKVRPGPHTEAAIILLTDGESNVGPDPLEAAREAADRGIRIFTVGIGTAEGAVIHVREWAIHVSLDEETLKTIADLTGGNYYNARNAADLKRVYQTLNSRLSLEKEETEITALFAGLGGLLGILSCVLSLLWFNRIL